MTDVAKVVRCPDCMGKGVLPVLLKGCDPESCSCTNGTVEVFWQFSPEDSMRHLFQNLEQGLFGLCGHWAPSSQVPDNVKAVSCNACAQVFNMLNNSVAIDVVNDGGRRRGGFT
jgi:hypothetical protein